MDWRWVILSAIAKIFFALGPKTVRSQEFVFGDGPEWNDIQGIMAVAACRGMLASFPITITIQTYLKTDAANDGFCAAGVAPFQAVAILLLAAVLVAGMLRIPAKKLMSTSRLIPLVLLLVTAETGYTYALGNTKMGREAVVELLCAQKSATAKVPSPAGLAASPAAAK